MTARTPSALNAARRNAELDRVAAGEPIDVLVIGGGITGAGVALDAASRGLSTVLVERRDLAWGTSRWSSKLFHGGLRYLASGDLAVAYESARERRIAMTTTAPHLIRPLPQLIPITRETAFRQRAFLRAGLLAGDVLRRTTGSGTDLLPRSRGVGRAEALRFVPGLRSDDLQGGVLGWDGQLVDDARLVVAVARTAAAYGARILTRVSADDVTDTEATLHDERSGQRFHVSAGAIVNAAGVWAGDVDATVRLRPSRGTHLVLPRSAFGDFDAALTVPIPGERNRFVFALPAPHHRVYVGLTDEPAPGPIPSVPEPSEAEIDRLLATIGSVLHTPIARSDMLGAFAGLRPLLDSGSQDTADLSRRHSIRHQPDGPITVIGGKLTTYRHMAEDTVDQAIARAGLPRRPCRTSAIALVGASKQRAAPRWLPSRYGGEASAVAAMARTAEDLEPIADGIDVCAAEFAYALAYEGALDVDDLLDRRTRIGLVPDDRVRALPAAREALERSEAHYAV